MVGFVDREDPPTASLLFHLNGVHIKDSYAAYMVWVVTQGVCKEIDSSVTVTG